MWQFLMDTNSRQPSIMDKEENKKTTIAIIVQKRQIYMLLL